MWPNLWSLKISSVLNDTIQRCLLSCSKSMPYCTSRWNQSVAAFLFLLLDACVWARLNKLLYFVLVAHPKLDCSFKKKYYFWSTIFGSSDIPMRAIRIGQEKWCYNMLTSDSTSFTTDSSIFLWFFLQFFFYIITYWLAQFYVLLVVIFKLVFLHACGIGICTLYIKLWDCQTNTCRSSGFQRSTETSAQAENGTRCPCNNVELRSKDIGQSTRECALRLYCSIVSRKRSHLQLLVILAIEMHLAMQLTLHLAMYFTVCTEIWKQSSQISQKWVSWMTQKTVRFWSL